VNAENSAAIAQKIDEALKDGTRALTLELSRDIMELAGVPFNRSGMAHSPEEAVKVADGIGYPVVMKIVSPQVIHKTEFGGVEVGVGSPEDVQKKYTEIVDRVKAKAPDADIVGILLEEMVKGTELIIGMVDDAQFGPMLMFGIGGIFVEVYKDVSFRLIPITDGDAGEMMEELQGAALLHGVRGTPKADPEQLRDILRSVSGLVEAHPRIKELDLNPLMITKRGTIAVDARIIVEE
jgi:acyl-CoA synthetase (NDP forming)